MEKPSQIHLRDKKNITSTMKYHHELDIMTELATNSWWVVGRPGLPIYDSNNV